jgi:ankyrin repeat protein
MYLTKLLLENGADINKKDIDGFSVTAIAIDSLSFEMCQLLLKYNPIIDVRNIF